MPPVGLARLPALKPLSDAEYADFLRTQMMAATFPEADPRLLRSGALGQRPLIDLSKFDASYRPKHPKRGFRPQCHATEIEARKAFRKERYAWCQLFYAASAEDRAGHKNPRYPRGAFPPARPPVPWELSDTK